MFNLLILISNLFCPWLIGIASLQAMDNPEVHDLRQGQGPEYIEKIEPFVAGTSKLKYTFCYQPQQASLQKDSSQQGEPPPTPYVIQDGLVAKVTTEEPESRKQSGSSSSDNWGQVLYPSQWPHRVHGHLMMRFEKEAITVGSGILVGPNHVLTAGHNLYYKGQWAKEIWFTPGRKGNDFPFGYSKGCLLLCPHQWLDPKSRNKKDDYDLGMVILDRALGNEAGWSGLLYAPDTYFDHWEIIVTGYPGEKGSKDYYSTEMWEGKDATQGTVFNPETITYGITTSFGQSGGAIWRQWPSPPNSDQTSIFTIGIHTEGGSSGKNKGVRLTKEKFEWIIHWIKTYHLKDSVKYSIPSPTLPPLTKVKRTADEWWNQGNTFFQRSNYEEAFTCFYNAMITAGDLVPDHMLLSLADCYSQGKGTRQNYLEAFNLHMQTENPRKSPETLFLIGKCYLEGLDIPKYITAGLYFLTQAAEKGNREAVKELYHFYSDPGKTRDLKKAEQYHKQAQNLGIEISSFPLSLLNSNVRRWKKVVDEEPLHNLYYNAPAVEGLIDSYPEGSDKSYLTLLWELLNSSNQVTISSAHKSVISGMGGIGKTSLAARYAHEALANKAYKLIYWLGSETDDRLKEGYRNLLGLFNVTVKETDPFGKLLMLLNNNLPKPWLLIYDNVRDSRFLDNKTLTNGHILITSRCQEGWGHEILPLDVFSPKNAVEYLFESINPSTHQIERNKETEQVAEQTAEELGRLPLALSHAISYINFKRQSDQGYGFGNYLEDFKNVSLALLRSNWRYLGKNITLDYGYLIKNTITMAQGLISPWATELLTYFSYLDPDTILKEAFFPRIPEEKEPKEERLKHLSVMKEIEEIADPFSELVIFSLIKNNGFSFSIHRLVQLVQRADQESAENIRDLPPLLEGLVSRFSFFWQNLSQGFQGAYSLSQLHQKNSIMLSHLARIEDHLKRLSVMEKIKGKILLLESQTQNLQGLYRKTHALLRNKVFEQREKETALLKEIVHKEIREAGIKLTMEECQDLLSLYPQTYLSHQEIIENARTLETIPPLQRQDFVSIFKQLPLKKREKYRHSGIMAKFATIDAKDWEEVMKIAQHLFAQKIGMCDSDSLIKQIKSVADLEEGKDPTKVPKFNRIIEFLTTLDTARRERWLARAQKVFTEEIDTDSGIEIVKRVSCLEAGNWDRYKNLGHLIQRVDGENWDRFKRLIKEVKAKQKVDKKYQIDEEKYEEIRKALAKIDIQHWEKLIQFLEVITEKGREQSSSGNCKKLHYILRWRYKHSLFHKFLENLEHEQKEEITMNKIKDWDNTGYFYAAALEGNLIKAARSLAMSSLALDEILNEFEKELGNSLLIRTPRKLVLTNRGEKMFCHARIIALGEENIANLLMLEENELPKQITLALPSGFTSTSLFTKLRDIFKSYPDLQITLVRSDQSFDLEKFNILSAEVKIVRDEAEEPDLRYTFLSSYTYGLYAHPTYLEEHGCPENREDLKNHTLISPVNPENPQLYGYSDWVLRSGPFGWIKPKQLIVPLNAIENVYQEAIKGKGIAILPSDSLFLESGEFVPVLAHLQSPEIPMYLAYPEEVSAKEEVKSLERYLIDAFQCPQGE